MATELAFIVLSNLLFLNYTYENFQAAQPNTLISSALFNSSIYNIIYMLKCKNNEPSNNILAVLTFEMETFFTDVLNCRIR